MSRWSSLIRAFLALPLLLLLASAPAAARAPVADRTGAAAAAEGGCRPLAPGASAAAERAVAVACAQVAAGVWYTWGGGHGPQPGPTYGQVDPTDPASEHDPERLGFDCSGLVRYAYAEAAGADILDGVASRQFYTHRAAQRFTAAQGLAPLLPGDLLAWGTSQDLHHIAIYLGGGKMVEARQSGTRLMVSDVRLDSGYFGALRVNTGAVTGHIHQTWGSGVWTKAEPSLRAARVRLPVLDDHPRPVPEARGGGHLRGVHQRRLVVPARLPGLGDEHLHQGTGLAGRGPHLHVLTGPVPPRGRAPRPRPGRAAAGPPPLRGEPSRPGGGCARVAA
ncbi:C40 family peptidase [Streptomyces sudanensis]|uniref:C40 family peptidase n=1 Tax=Streptomyces sudanensis TaxID=436397 RepID=UPI0020CE2195|nr:NlpC/P60 family protein [Streptomyces sudanensis]MCP9988274.1 C40 family peptidase [Streptomyces sudanensis]